MPVSKPLEIPSPETATFFNEALINLWLNGGLQFASWSIIFFCLFLKLSSPSIAISLKSRNCSRLLSEFLEFNK